MFSRCMTRLGNVELILGKEQVSGGKRYEEEKEDKLHARYSELEGGCGLRINGSNCMKILSLFLACLLFADLISETSFSMQLAIWLWAYWELRFFVCDQKLKQAVLSDSSEKFWRYFDNPSWITCSPLWPDTGSVTRTRCLGGKSTAHHNYSFS